ncbi:MAG TPA: hypothetical protein VIF09_14090 [Polyangiaceae bacterium]|jgi:hypothetical protein
MASPTKWVDTTAPFARSPGEYAQVAVERLADQLHLLSLRVARARAPSGWLHDATTLAVSTASVPVAIARLEQLRAELVASLERDPRKDAVYHLAVSFIPIATTKPYPTPREGGV